VGEINPIVPTSTSGKVLSRTDAAAFHGGLTLERGNGSTEDCRPRHRLVETSQGGQRGLIVSPPPKAAKPMLCRTSPRITANSSEVDLIVLLIDERPERK